MSRPLLVLTVALAGYGIVSTLTAAVVALLWRRQYVSGSAASLAALRFLPAVTGALITALIIVPAFAIFEPMRDSEPAGPIVLALAGFTLAITGSALRAAMRTLVQTARLARQWLRSAERMDADPTTGIVTYVIDSATPFVALIGVFSPRLVAARTIVDACSSQDFAVIVAHEAGHLRAHDNLKRWLLECAPDVLRWTRLHDDIMQAWRDAAEDAADDAAARANPEARINLAALLLKVARLSAEVPVPATVIAFADADGLERRVRRLVSETVDRTTAGRVEMAALVAASCAVALTLSQPAVLRGIHVLLEITIQVGR